MKKTILVYILFISSFIYSQSGKISYVAHINIDTVFTPKMEKKIDSLKYDKSEMKEMMKSMANNNEDISYTLTFNVNESLFKKEESLENDNEKGINFLKFMAGSDDYYTSILDKKIIRKTEKTEKTYLINYSFPKWKYSNETKKIGKYLCYKATTTRTHKNTFTGNTKTFVITAWYTKEIPINFGPKNYGGLPGLIIQLTDASVVFTATNVKINPKKSIKIKKPEKGEVITAEAYNEMKRVSLKKRFAR